MYPQSGPSYPGGLGRLPDLTLGHADQIAMRTLSLYSQYYCFHVCTCIYLNSIGDRKGQTTLFPCTRLTCSSLSSLPLRFSSPLKCKQHTGSFKGLTECTASSADNSSLSLGLDYRVNRCVTTDRDLMCRFFSYFSTNVADIPQGSAPFLLLQVPTVGTSRGIPSRDRPTDSLNRVGNVKAGVHNGWILIVTGVMEATSVLLAVHILTGNPIPR